MPFLTCPLCQLTRENRSALIRHIQYYHKEILNPASLVPHRVEEAPVYEIIQAPDRLCVMCECKQAIHSYAGKQFLSGGVICYQCRKAYRLDARKHSRTALERAQRAQHVREQVRKAVLKAYGEKCACCGEPESVFLSIDHVNGGGNWHLRRLTNNHQGGFYLWLIRSNFPKGFRTLCMNCQVGYKNQQTCPHQLAIPAAGTGDAVSPAPCKRHQVS